MGVKSISTLYSTCIVSAIANASVSNEKARPSGEFVPGELMYIVIVASLWKLRYSSCAMTNSVTEGTKGMPM